MRASKKPMLEIQRDPYDPFVPDGARVMVLGSTPPGRFCAEGIKPLKERDLDYYYGSCDRSYNLFWEVLFRVLDPSGLPELTRIRSLSSAREHRTFVQRDFLQTWLANQGLGIMDILERFERRDGSGADSKLRPLEFAPLLEVLAAHSYVEAICCTSQSRVCEWLRQYLEVHQIVLETETEGYSFTLPGNQTKAEPPRRIMAMGLPSPSPIGRIRFPNHQAWLEHLVAEYRRIFALAGLAQDNA